MLKIIRIEIDGQIGLELDSLDEKATIADLFVPLQLATDDPTLPKQDHSQRYAICAGCSNSCCRRYAILPDLLTVRLLMQTLETDLKTFAKQYLRLEADQPFAEFRGRGCPFLKLQLCSIYKIRPAFCRFYLCVPSGERLEKLKAQVSLLGEMALRDYLIAANLGPLSWRSLPRIKAAKNPLATATAYSSITLRECCSDEFWQWLQLPKELTQWQTYAEWQEGNKRIKGVT